MHRRIAIFALLVAIVSTAAAQNDSILVNDRDTIAYSYTPITFPNTATQPAPKPKSEAWQKIVRYFTESARDKSFEKKVDFTFIPGIYYSNSTSAGLALVAAGLYRLDRENRTLPASDFSIYATVSLTGFYRVAECMEYFTMVLTY